MIRPFTLVCMLLACGSGLYLYQVKYRVLMLDRQISTTVQATTAARDRAGMLRTEWTLLNDPERLRALADQHLQLKPLATSQLAKLAELGDRLPAPRTAEVESEADAPVVARQEPASVPPAPAPPVQMPAVASPTTVAKAMIRPSAEAAVRPAEHRPAAVRIAAASASPPRPAMPVTPARAPTPVVPMRVMASIAPTPAVSPPASAPSIPRELIAQLAPQLAPQLAHGKPLGASLPMMASALGMARTLLPPPVPIVSASTMSRDGN